MTTRTADDWTMGDAYEAYMGRWSRLLAREFLSWLRPDPHLNWLEIGCGTGALTSNICASCSPTSIVACDQSSSFVEHARSQVPDSCCSFVARTSDELPSKSGGFDVIVSGLVLNFLPSPALAVASMRERLRPGGTLAAYVWDYAGGVEFLSHFWEEARTSNPDASPLDEATRFGHWREPELVALFTTAGLSEIESAVLGIKTRFESFEDFWTPFLGGTGPAPSYVASLPLRQREELAERLRSRLPTAPDGSITCAARGLALRGVGN